MKLLSIPSTAWESNTYLLVSGADAVVCDPASPADVILAAAARESAHISLIVMTHGHFDHMLSLSDLRRKTGADVCIHSRDAAYPASPTLNASRLLTGRDMVFSPAERLLAEGDVISFGSDSARVLHTPGHTGGSVCLLCGGDLICGDTLFAEGFGRYDLPGGDPGEFVCSIRRLHGLDGNIVIHPGHGDCATLGAATDPNVFRFLAKGGD